MNIITATFALVKVAAAIFICKTNDKQNKMRRNVKTKLKTYVAAMAMLFIPLAISGQTDGFFGSDNGGGNMGVPPKDDPVNNGVTGEPLFDFDSPVGGGGVAPQNEGPIGSGLLIMAAAGAGYLLLKKKEEK